MDRQPALARFARRRDDAEGQLVHPALRSLNVGDLNATLGRTEVPETIPGVHGGG
jgi:hypothetical protein